MLPHTSPLAALLSSAGNLRRAEGPVDARAVHMSGDSL